MILSQYSMDRAAECSLEVTMTKDGRVELTPLSNTKESGYGAVFESSHDAEVFIDGWCASLYVAREDK